MPLSPDLGFEPVGWLVERSINNFGALIAIMIWLQTGFCMVAAIGGGKGHS